MNEIILENGFLDGLPNDLPLAPCLHILRGLCPLLLVGSFRWLPLLRVLDFLLFSWLGVTLDLHYWPRFVKLASVLLQQEVRSSFLHHCLLPKSCPRIEANR